MICGKQLLLSAEVDIAIVIDMCLIAEIVVLHIVELVEHAIVEHIGEHILLPDQPIVLNLRQLALGVYPTLAVVREAHPLMTAEFHPQRFHAAIASIVQDHRRRLLLLQPADELLLIGVIHLRQIRILMYH